MVTGLRPWTTYELAVAGYNNAGMGILKSQRVTTIDSSKYTRPRENETERESPNVALGICPLQLLFLDVTKTEFWVPRRLQS